VLLRQGIEREPGELELVGRGLKVLTPVIANTIKSNQPLGEEVLIGHFAEDPSDLRGGTSEKQDFDGIGIDGKFEEVAAGQPVLAFKVADEYLRRRARCRDSGEKRVAVG